MIWFDATGLPAGVVAGIIPRRQAVGNPRGVSFGTSGPWSPREVELYRDTVLASLGRSRAALCTLRQRHGRAIFERSGSGAGGTIAADRGLAERAPEGDAHWTRDAAVLLTIQVADCFPVVIADVDASVVALAHVGWRGAEAGIVPAVVQTLAAAGIAADRLRAWVGPGADASRYEVGPAVADRFGAWPHAVRRDATNRLLLDIGVVIRCQLRDAGLAEDAITIDGRGTIGDPSFHSHRRDGREAGRMWVFAARVDDGRGR